MRFAFLLCLLWATSLQAEERSPSYALDSELPYLAERANPVTYDVDYSVVITAPYHTKTLRVWLPLPQSDRGQEVEPGKLTSFPQEVKPKIASEPVFGNHFAYFEYDHPNGAQIIRHRFQIKIWELRWNVDPAKIAAVHEWPSGFDRYLRGDATVAIDDAFTRFVNEKIGPRRGPSKDLMTAMNWVSANIKYDHANASLRASSRHALETGAGHCSDYHGLCAAMGRVLGTPTRVTYGINTFDKNSPSHCKLEAFLPGYGWVSFDVSETQRLVATIGKDASLDAGRKEQLVRAANARLVRGFRDNTWFVQTRGTDYELVPPTSERVPVVRTIYAEADGVALPDPDPANPQKQEFAWMTVHKFTPDKAASYPFQDWKSLEK